MAAVSGLIRLGRKQNHSPIACYVNIVLIGFVDNLPGPEITTDIQMSRRTPDVSNFKFGRFYERDVG